MKFLVTGGGGFLGWHTRCLLHALGHRDVAVASRSNWDQLDQLTAGADVVLHLAGVNRAAPADLVDGNATLAEDVARAVRRGGSVSQIVFANSVQVDGNTPYGEGKRRASEELQRCAAETGARYADVVLPNIFGEHSRPGYNSFVATFVDAVLSGQHPQVQDRDIDLMHAQSAAGVLIGAAEGGTDVVRPVAEHRTTVQQVHDLLQAQRRTYLPSGDIPTLGSALELDLFNQLRAACFPSQYPIRLTLRTDARGSFVETVRAHGGQGQTSYSTTKPGVTRGEHYHLKKVERFVVVQGQARISLRRLHTDDVVSFDVTGSEPVVVDMPTMWVHNITNVGTTELMTLFWSHDIFDPEAPDTYPARVEPLVG